MASWYDNFDSLQSPKYMDQMFSNCALFNPVPTIEDDYEEGDIHLWNFCWSKIQSKSSKPHLLLSLLIQLYSLMIFSRLLEDITDSDRNSYISVCES